MGLLVQPAEQEPGSGRQEEGSCSEGRRQGQEGQGPGQVGREPRRPGVASREVGPAEPGRDRELPLLPQPRARGRLTPPEERAVSAPARWQRQGGQEEGCAAWRRTVSVSARAAREDAPRSCRTVSASAQGVGRGETVLVPRLRAPVRRGRGVVSTPARERTGAQAEADEVNFYWRRDDVAARSCRQTLQEGARSARSRCS